MKGGFKTYIPYGATVAKIETERWGLSLQGVTNPSINVLISIHSNSICHIVISMYGVWNLLMISWSLESIRIFISAIVLYDQHSHFIGRLFRNPDAPV